MGYHDPSHLRGNSAACPWNMQSEFYPYCPSPHPERSENPVEYPWGTHGTYHFIPHSHPQPAAFVDMALGSDNSDVSFMPSSGTVGFSDRELASDPSQPREVELDIPEGAGYYDEWNRGTGMAVHRFVNDPEIAERERR
jgi:hypothetical protein